MIGSIRGWCEHGGYAARRVTSADGELALWFVTCGCCGSWFMNLEEPEGGWRDRDKMVRQFMALEPWC